MITKVMASLLVGLVVGTGTLAVTDQETRTEMKAKVEARTGLELPGLSLGASSRTEVGAQGSAQSSEPAQSASQSTAQGQAEARAKAQVESSGFWRVFARARAEGNGPLASIRIAFSAWLD